MPKGSRRLNFNTGELKQSSLGEKIERGITTDKKVEENEIKFQEYNRDMERLEQQRIRIENSGLSAKDQKELLLELRAEGVKLERHFEGDVVKEAEKLQEMQQELIDQGESMVSELADIQDSFKGVDFETDKVSMAKTETAAIRKKEEVEKYVQERVVAKQRHREMINRQMRDMRAKRLRSNRSSE